MQALQRRLRYLQGRLETPLGLGPIETEHVGEGVDLEDRVVVVNRPPPFLPRKTGKLIMPSHQTGVAAKAVQRLTQLMGLFAPKLDWEVLDPVLAIWVAPHPDEGLAHVRVQFDDGPIVPAFIRFRPQDGVLVVDELLPPLPIGHPVCHPVIGRIGPDPQVIGRQVGIGEGFLQIGHAAKGRP